MIRQSCAKPARSTAPCQVSANPGGAVSGAWFGPAWAARRSQVVRDCPFRATRAALAPRTNFPASISLNDLSSLEQHVLGDDQAQRLGRLEIDDEAKLARLLDWKILGLGPFQNAVYIVSGASVQAGEARSKGDEPAEIDV